MFHLDPLVFQWLNATADSPAWLVPFARFASLEMPELLIAGAGGAFLVGDTQVRCAMLRTGLAMVIALVIARLLQHRVPMARPFTLGIGIQWLEHGRSAGFPSTHASVAFAFSVAAAMSTRSRWLIAALLLSATTIAWSRVCLGLHFPSDVLAGVLVGATSAWLGSIVPIPYVLRTMRSTGRDGYTNDKRGTHETLA